MVIKMADVKSAVVRASNKSQRDGSWANRVEIKEKIVGTPPANLEGELVKLVRAGAIEKKSGAMYWRPVHGTGAAGSPSAKRNRVSEPDDRERGDRDKDRGKNRDDRKDRKDRDGRKDKGDRRERDDKKPDGRRRGDRLTEDTARAATGGALAAGVGGSAAGAASSSITRMLM